MSINERRFVALCLFAVTLNYVGQGTPLWFKVLWTITLGGNYVLAFRATMKDGAR